MKIKGNMAKAMKFTPDILGKGKAKLWSEGFLSCYQNFLYCFVFDVY